MSFKKYLEESEISKFEKKKINKTLKVWFEKFEQNLWNYYRTDKTVGKWIKQPTFANMEQWYNFWKSKVEFSELDIEYIEYVVNKGK